jgi:integrase
MTAGLRHQRFHDLRQTCASLLLESGVSPREVMDWPGHSQISVTMNTHVAPHRSVLPTKAAKGREGTGSLIL